MWKIKHLFMNAEQGAEAPAGSTGGNDGGNGGGAENPGAGNPAGNSLLSTGAGEPGANDWIPEKYRVMGEGGKLDIEALPANWRMLTRRLKSALQRRHAAKNC